MLPKKKKASEKAFQKESIPSKPEIKQIRRRKPHFRYVDYDSLSRAQHIRVKFWKFHSCNLSHFNPEFLSSYVQFSNNRTEQFQRKEKFENSLKHWTIKRSLRSLRRMRFSSTLLSKETFFIKLCKSWKLETLYLSVTPEKKPSRLLKTFMNSKLKDCFLKTYFESSANELSPKFLSCFRRLPKSNLFIQSSRNNLKMLLNTSKLYASCKSQQLMHSSETIHQQVIRIAPPESFERISYETYDDPDLGIIKLPHLPSLPNLKDLQFVWSASSQEGRLVDISFVEKYSKLERLGIQLDFKETESLDFLTKLPLLKEFYFSSRQPNTRQGPLRSLPNLTKLEKLVLYSKEPILFAKDGLRNFISNNKDLKSLDLSLPIQHIATIFEEEGNITLPRIEKLRLHFIRCEKSHIGTARIIAKTLKRLDSTKQLHIEISHSSIELNTILLKEGLASCSFIKKLTLKYHESGGFGVNKFHHLKNVFTNLQNLKTIELDLSSDSLSSKEFSSILESLCRLKHLEKFRFAAKLTKLTSAASNKLLNFLVSIRHIRDFHVSLRGIPEEDGIRIKENLLPKFPLSQDTFSFISFVD